MGDIEDIDGDVVDSRLPKPKLKIKVTFKPKEVCKPVSLTEMLHVTPTAPSSMPPKLVKSQIISASRRTDIPAFYMPQMMEVIQRGYIEVTSPYGVKSNVSLSPIDVKCFVWWSKDYANWLQLYKIHTPIFAQYRHMFNFTLTGDSVLEPGLLSSFEHRLQQLSQLVDIFGSVAIKLRFDPIVVYYDKSGKLCDNLGQFETVIQYASKLGIKSVIFAFCIGYPHVVRRMSKHGLTLKKLSLEEQRTILDPLLDICAQNQIQLQTCCGSGLINYKLISASRCVDGEVVNQLCGNSLKTTRKDSGQRKECNCAVSRDIGSYHLKCGHECLYCYVKGGLRPLKTPNG